MNHKSLGNPIYAAALQDHLSKSLGLESKNKTRRCIHPQKRLMQKYQKEIDAMQMKIHGKSKTKKQEFLQETEQERVLDPIPKPLTLAQKLGLVEKPKSRLTDLEWEKVKETAQQRHDPSCPICQEKFTLESQILLSCSHIYHRSCLESYEKYVQQKSCPLCRHANYEKRLSFDGRKLYRMECIIKIQSIWRGYICRKAYREYRQKNPPKDPILCKKYHYDKLSRYNQELQDQMHQDTRNINSFLASIDQELENVRSIMSHCDLAETQDPFIIEKVVDWDQIYLKACQRGLQEENCSICITNLYAQSRSMTLLSCSHVFHSKCLSCFEKYDLKTQHVCPICRTEYSRIDIS